MVVHGEPGSYKAIRKQRSGWAVAPNLVDYDASRAGFSWDQARGWLDGLPGGAGLNIAHEAVDRHAAGALRDRVAIRWLGKDGASRDLTFADLREQTNRFANVLGSLGVGKGDRVYGLMGRLPELYVAALGTLKNRSVFCPLFSAFGPEPIRARMTIGQAKALVTTRQLYERKVASIRSQLPDLEHVLIVDADASATAVDATDDYAALMSAASPEFEIQPTDPELPALLHFTSGTTGTTERGRARPSGRLGTSRDWQAGLGSARRTISFGARPTRAGSRARRMALLPR